MTTISPAALPSAPRPPRGGRSRGRLPLTPGRRAALLLGVPVVLAIIVYNGYDIVLSIGQGSFPVRDNVTVAGSGLTVSLGGGSGTVRGGTSAPGVARMSGTVTYHLARASVRTGVGDIGLDCPWLDEGNCSLDATVDIPSGTALTMRTGGGDLTASDLTGGATLSSDGGNITLRGAAGPLGLFSSGGDVTVSNVSGEAATISADGGTINGTGVGIPRVSADSSGGDIALTFTAIPSDLQVHSDGGNVTIVVPHGSYIVRTNTDGGNLTHQIPSTAGARNVITVSSSGGDISLSESS